MRKTRKSLDQRNLSNLINMSRIIPIFKIFQGKDAKKNKSLNLVKLFDLAVVATLLVVASVFLYTKFTKKSTWVEARVMISNDSWWWHGEAPEYWLIDELSQGLASYNSFGEEVAVIKGMEVFSLGGPTRRAYLDLSMKVSYDKKRQIYLFNYQPLQKGKPLDLTFGKTAVQGLVIGLASDPEERYEKKIRVRMQYLEDWNAQSYKEGMEWNDSNGKLIARIDKVKVEPTNMYNLTFFNNGIQKNNVIFKDVYMDLTVAAIKGRDGQFRFVDGASIRVSDEIWFHFPTVVANTQIIELLD